MIGKHYLYIIIDVIITFCFICGFEIPYMNLLVLMLSVFLIKNPSSIIPLIFVSSWSTKFTVLPFLGAYYYFMLLFCASIVLNKRTYGVFNTQNTDKHIILLIIWLIITMPFSLSGNYELTTKISISLLFILLVSGFRIYEKNILFIKRCLIIVSSLVSVFWFYRATMSPCEYILEQDMSWGTNIRSWFSVLPQLNPNSACQILVIVSVILFYTALLEKRKILLIPFLCNLYTILFLGSRTSLISLLFISTIIYFFVFKPSTKIKLLIIILICFLYFGIDYIIAEYLSSFRILTDSILDDRGSGRFDTWMKLWNNIIPIYWPTGIGIGRLNYSMIGFQYDADNMYFDLLCQTGLFGMIMVLYNSYLNIKKSIRQYKMDITTDLTFCLMVGTFLIVGFGESVFDTTLYWSCILLSTISLRVIKHEQNEKIL